MQPLEGEKPPIGAALDQGSGLRRVIAPNPSPLTYWGTNTYLLGHRDIAVIDPGPPDPDHLAAILDALEAGQRISHILVTHAHLDHSGLAAALSAKTGAPILAFGDASAGRSPLMDDLALSDGLGGGEGVDHAFTPDLVIGDGEVILGPDWRLTALWTPGHFGNHLCFAMDDIVFTGDLVMGWATSLISPPDGDLARFMTSCERLRSLSARRLLPGHGAAIEEPASRIDWLISHRKAREAQILETLRDGPQSATQIARRIYSDVPGNLLAAASRNVLAHLIDLRQKLVVSAQRPIGPDSLFSRHDATFHGD